MRVLVWIYAFVCFVTLRIVEHAARLVTRILPPARTDPLDWGSGVSIIIPERAGPAMLEECLLSVKGAQALVSGPVETIIVVNGSGEEDYSRLRTLLPEALWLVEPRPLGFVQAIGRGLEVARYQGVYLLNNDMTLEPEALQEVLRWRAPNIFAVASQILFHDPDRRREETGWTDLQVVDGGVDIFDVLPEDQTTVRGHLYAGGGSSLFHRDALRNFTKGRDPYRPFYWEDAEWGVRAWRHGYEVIYCPASRAWHRHRATVSRFYALDEIERIFQRNKIRFQLRNFPETIRWSSWYARVQELDRRSLAEIFQASSWVRGRISFYRSPFRTVQLDSLRKKVYGSPSISGDRRPLVLIVTPYAIYPPQHGGSVRLHQLIRELSNEFRILVLSDEGDLYCQASVDYCRPLTALHPIHGRPEATAGETRTDRIRSHSHDTLSSEVRRLIATYRPDLVQVEFVELCDLILSSAKRVPWVLTLHDVLVNNGRSGPTREDHFELERIRRFDSVVTCSYEDARLLPGDNVHVVPNGIDAGAFSYRPSPPGRRILFAGPFRYQPNLDGIQEFLVEVYPRLRERVDDVELVVLGGANATELAKSMECFGQPGVLVVDYMENIRPALEDCTLTINPVTGIRGSSIKLIESVAAGRVCVSTKEGARGFLEAGFPSLVVTGRIEEFAGPIEHLLLDNEHRRLVETPPKNLLQEYSWRKSAQMLADVYRRELDRQAGPGTA